MTEAQRLADELEDSATFEMELSFLPAELRSAAAELRRLEAENARMRSELDRPMSSEATVLAHDNARLRAEVQALREALAQPAAQPTIDLSRLEPFVSGLGTAILQELKEDLAAQPVAQPTEPVQITDQMAYAFHAALSDGSIGADDVNEIKTGLAAAFAHITAAQPTEPAGEPVAHFGSAYVNENGVHITTVLGPVAIPQDAALYTRPAVPLTDERERLCAAIKAADDKASENDYMLDSDDCIKVIRGTWNPQWDKIGGAE